MLEVNENRVYPDPGQAGSFFNGPGEIYTALQSVPEFRMQYADHIYRHMFHDGALTTEANLTRLNDAAAIIDRAIVAESARWGDGSRDDVFPPRTRDDDWIPRMEWLRETYFPQRGQIVLNQYRQQGLYPNLNPPEMSRHGGYIDPDFDGLILTDPNASAAVWYTLDGSDPRLPDGSISPTAQQFDSAIEFPESILLKTRTFDGSEWSALSEAEFLVTQLASAENLAIAEVNYNPYDPTDAELAANPDLDSGDFEFIELRNISDFAIDLAGIKFTGGVTFEFGLGVERILDPGKAVVLVADTDAFALRRVFPLPDSIRADSTTAASNSPWSSVWGPRSSISPMTTSAHGPVGPTAPAVRWN